MLGAMLCSAVCPPLLAPAMRLRISHLTSYRYETPATSVIQMLRLTPRNHDGQYVTRWRIDVSDDCRLDQHEDAFGNITHAFTADGPFGELTVLVEGEVETRDTQGIVRGAVERFPPSLYLRETTLRRRADVAAFAAAGRDAGGGNVLKLLHLMLERLHDDMTSTPTPPTPPPRQRKPSRSSAASARTSPISSSRPPAASASRRAMSAAIFAATTA